MNIKNCTAPIIIPTLNRYEHLKMCIESLLQNDLARKSDIFISVDYPPSEKYIEGHNRIVEYLNGGLIGFRKTHVFYQDHNIGPHENFLFLLNQISEDYSCFIFSEDDNVFSSDFLCFMNYCLNEYKDDDRIQAVDGYLWPISNTNTDGIIRINSLFNAWGYGGWIKKEYDLLKKIEKDRLADIWNNRKLMHGLKKYNPFIYSEFIKGYIGYSGCLLSNDNKIRAIDLSYSLIEFIEGTYTIFPIGSKVKNYGNDGSGANCDEIKFDKSISVSNRNYDYSSQDIKAVSQADYRGEISEGQADSIYMELMNFLSVPKDEIIKSDIVYYVSLLIGIKRIRYLINRLKDHK